MSAQKPKDRVIYVAAKKGGVLLGIVAFHRYANDLISNQTSRIQIVADTMIQMKEWDTYRVVHVCDCGPECSRYSNTADVVHIYPNPAGSLVA